jgi:5'-deoxynucleotidase YfbR-like HD superfamily hydrolase
MWEELISAAHECQRLDYTPRYSTIPITVPESVSTHSYFVALYAAMIHTALDPDDAETLAACLIYAVIHDSIEGLGSGDIVRTFKYRTKALKEAIDEAEAQVIEESPSSLKRLFSTTNLLYKKTGKADYIKSVVKAADFMSLHNFMIREVNRSNREIIPFYKRMVQDLREMARQNNGVKFSTGGKDFIPTEFYNELVENALGKAFI